MGEWSDAIEDGVFCARCQALLYVEGEPLSGRPTLCDDCVREAPPLPPQHREERPDGSQPLGPNWLPPRG